MCVKVINVRAIHVVFVSELREKLSQVVQEKTRAVADVEALRDHLRDTRDEVSRSRVNGASAVALKPMESPSTPHQVLYHPCQF